MRAILFWSLQQHALKIIVWNASELNYVNKCRSLKVPPKPKQHEQWDPSILVFIERGEIWSWSHDPTSQVWEGLSVCLSVCLLTNFNGIYSFNLSPVKLSPLLCSRLPSAPHSLLKGTNGSGSPLISSPNKQPGKHHETFKGGRAAFSLIHTGKPGDAGKQLLQALRPLQRDFASHVRTCPVCAFASVGFSTDVWRFGAAVH